MLAKKETKLKMFLEQCRWEVKVFNKETLFVNRKGRKMM